MLVICGALMMGKVVATICPQVMIVCFHLCRQRMLLILLAVVSEKNHHIIIGGVHFVVWQVCRLHFFVVRKSFFVKPPQIVQANSALFPINLSSCPLMIRLPCSPGGQYKYLSAKHPSNSRDTGV